MGDRPVHGPLLIRRPRPADAVGVLEVVVARDVADFGHADYVLEDVESEWNEPAAHCELWTDDSEGGVRRLATVGGTRTEWRADRWQR